ncbi:MAG: hypothetical protein K6C12_14820 [Oscillospiraceae bacterium]|nr:hypothetical protein [Oscillospiraceae bacterium]
MSKKIFALILVLALAASLMTTAVYAAGETADDPIILDYHDIDTSVYDGAWVSTGLGFDVYLPSDWVLVDITAEQAAAGLAFLAGEEGGGANMTVTMMDAPQGYSLDQLAQELAATATTASYADLNRIPGVIFENLETKVSGYGILTASGVLITGVISAPSDDQYEAYSPYIKNMILSVSPSVTELNWEDIEADALEADADGATVTFDEIHLQMWVPSMLQEQELTDEDLEDGCYGYFADEDNEYGFTVYYYDDLTIEDYEEELKEYDNCSVPEPALVNGFKAFTYENTEYDTFNVVLSAGKDCMEFTAWPASDADFSDLITYMASSFMNV